MTLEYTNINGPEKGVYYRHALGKLTKILQNLFMSLFINYNYSLGGRANSGRDT